MSGMPDIPPQRKKLSGTVVSMGKMLRTITVTIERHPWHAHVRKQLRRHSTLLVDDPKSEARVGDRVMIEETRPLSKRKHFRLLQIVSRGPKAQMEVESGEQVTGIQGPLELASTTSGRGEHGRGNRSGSHPRKP